MMMRARTALVYAGRNIAAGQAFELILSPSTEAERRVLLASRLAEDIEQAAGGDKPPAKGKYKRRDLRAEE
jgi:hypothetical protein